MELENRPLQNTGDPSVTEEQDATLVRSYRLNSTREVFRVRSGRLNEKPNIPRTGDRDALCPPRAHYSTVHR
jgi:hypothetical protein